MVAKCAEVRKVGGFGPFESGKKKAEMVGVCG